MNSSSSSSSSFSSSSSLPVLLRERLRKPHAVFVKAIMATETQGATWRKREKAVVSRKNEQKKAKEKENVPTSEKFIAGQLLRIASASGSP